MLKEVATLRISNPNHKYDCQNLLRAIRDSGYEIVQTDATIGTKAYVIAQNSITSDWEDDGK